MKIAGLVLAGGQASRMHGQDKAFLDTGKGLALDCVFARLQQECSAVAISANGDPARFGAWECPVLPDSLYNVGPLAGVLSGLEWAENNGYNTLITIPVDTPFTPAGLVDALMPAPSYARCGGQSHPLVAAWPVSARPVLAAQLSFLTQENKKHQTRVRTLANTLGARAVDFPLVEGMDLFMNINTPQDLMLAQKYCASVCNADAAKGNG
ncbi:molybdenum cofactor guanylyltransferase [Acetobacter oryzoeni]|uniref:Molybdenum cofactor guanylyltransferase n=1 Tax=Acetobacter oryzoeni TaxID=2500548 RepID=A0A5B9GPA0_9PROT|nr:molybdenum cofactor guanylyltransferase [Acetobacter oryzoeni]MCP1203559.1 molybdenum cofactor guanylyltransferase [Acetobacter oryzoeni]QEE85465.1 molybdenum cofactor guanylyltransferase [Acetobacter oryzoeni]